MARHDVLVANGLAQAFRDLAKHAVSRRVTEAVVDELEAVEVEVEQRDRLAAAARPRQRERGRLLEQRPVRQSGQLVVVGEVGDPLFRALALGDVVRDRDDPGRHSQAVEDRRVLGLEPEIAGLGGCFEGLTCKRPLDGVDRFLVVAVQLEHVPADQLARLESEVRKSVALRERDDAVAVERPQHDRCALDDRAQRTLAGLERGVGQRMVGEVVHGRHRAAALVLLPRQCRQGDDRGKARAVLADEANVQALGADATSLQTRLGHRLRLFLYELQHRPALDLATLVAEHRRHPRVQEAGPGVGVDHPNAGIGRVEDLPVRAFLARPGTCSRAPGLGGLPRILHPRCYRPNEARFLSLKPGMRPGEKRKTR